MNSLFNILLLSLVLIYACNQSKTSVINSSSQSITSTIEYDSTNKALTHRIDTFFSKRFKEKRFNGVALFADQGKIVYHKAFGMANISEKRLLKKTDAFQLASVSKTITSIATLQLVDKGKLRLEDTLQQFFPGFPFEKITIQQLLSHQSGLANYMYFVDKVYERKDSAISNEHMLTIMQRDTPQPYFKPNTRYHYCNTNYALLALVIEKVSKQTYEAYLDENIFEVAQMENAFVYNKNVQKDLPEQVIGYNAIYRKKENHYQNGIVGDKGIYASALDLFKLDRALTNGKLVSKELMAKAYEPLDARLSRLNRDNYGLGWRIQQSPEFGQVVYHGGWWKGFKSYFIRLLDQDQTIIVLTNVTKGSYLNRIEVEQLFNEELY
jgi:CubicO group peptidase (beta-lactamase class C family)